MRPADWHSCSNATRIEFACNAVMAAIFIPIRFEKTEPLAFLKSVAPTTTRRTARRRITR